MLTAHIKLLDTSISIRRKILPRLASDINLRFSRSGGRQKLQGDVRNLVRAALIDSPTIQDMITPGSELHAGLGLTNMTGAQYSLPTDKIESIIETVVGSIRVIVKPFRATNFNIHGSVEVLGIPENHEDLLNLPAAIQINTRHSGNFHDVGEPEYIPYLEWLLQSGGQIVVSGFYVWQGSGVDPQFSRTGYAVMKPGGNYSIPPEHVGGIGNNFITRAVGPVVKTDIPRLLRSMF
jgi:hypothetical protein